MARAKCEGNLGTFYGRWDETTELKFDCYVKSFADQSQYANHGAGIFTAPT